VRHFEKHDFDEDLRFWPSRFETTLRNILPVLSSAITIKLRVSGSIEMTASPTAPFAG